jgi:phosphate transport system protein
VNRNYETELDDLRQGLLLMAGRVEEMIRTSIRALIERDDGAARKTIEQDRRVNRAEIEIDELCRQILAGHKLEATDLRFVTLAFKMVVDLERIGDLAVNISERVLGMGDVGPEAPWDAITQMSEWTRSIVKDAIDAFVDSDAAKALAVIDRDDEVDELYSQTFRLLFDHISQHPSALEWGIHLLSVIKWLERMSDHGTNLAEQVVFMVQGTDIRHAGKLGDRRSS